MSVVHVKPQEADLDYLTADENGQRTLRHGHKYYVQVQGQMALMNFTSCDFVVWSKKGLLVDHVGFNKDFWLHVKEQLDEFYERHIIPILTNKAPPLPEPDAELPKTTKKTRKRSAKSTQGASTSGTATIKSPVKRSKRTKKLRWPCPVCSKSATEDSVACEGCDRWFHFTCVQLKGTEAFLDSDDFMCPDCRDDAC